MADIYCEHGLLYPCEVCTYDAAKAKGAPLQGPRPTPGEPPARVAVPADVAERRAVEVETTDANPGRRSKA